MSAEPEDFEAELGIQAFQDMSRAMDRLGVTLKQANAQRLTDLRLEGEQSSAARRAAQAAEDAARMAQNAAQEALQAAKVQFRSSLLWTALTGLGVVLAGILGGYFIGHSSGWEQGQAEGYASARDEKAAAAWANTPSGQRALALDRIGSLDMLARCGGQGWTTQKKQGQAVCFPFPDSHGSTTGWVIP